jgi:transcription antitermination factor NusG
MTTPSVLPYDNVALPWYAVRVRSHCEHMASSMLESKGYERFLPLVRSRRRWSDRVKELQVPLFPGYVFCQFDAAHRVPVLECPGVVGIVGFGSHPVAIPGDEIRSIQTMLASSLHVEPYPFLAPGQKIRIDCGPLAGVEGVVVEMKNHFRLVASVTLLQRSVSVEIDREWACPLPAAHHRPTLVPLPVPSHASTHS